MATMTVETSGDLKARLDREFASGRFKDQSALVQALLEAAIRSQWKEKVEQKTDEALDEVECGEFAP